MSQIQHQFELPNSTQTLAEGLVEYFVANPGLKRDADLMSPQARQFFRSHDAVHVVYGCGTSMPHEAVVKLASLFGTTGGIRVLGGYVHHETLDIYRKLPVGSTVRALLVAPCLIVRTIWRCAHQHRRWPWEDYNEFLSVPLDTIRAQFGIVVSGRSGPCAGETLGDQVP